MAVNAEVVDWLAKAKDGDGELNRRTLEDEKLAHHVAFASKVAYEAGLEYEAVGNRDGALNNFWEAIHIGRFITKLYDTDPDSSFLANWK